MSSVRAVFEELKPVECTHLGAVQEDLPYISGIPCWSREEFEEEGAGETMYNGLTSGPIPFTPALLLGEGDKDIGSEVEL